MASRSSGMPSSSSDRSHSITSRGPSPMRSLPSAWKFGSPSRNRMRSASQSAWCISSMDSLYSCSASSFSPQFFSILACRKYWLIAVSSLYRALLRYSMTLASPFICSAPLRGERAHSSAPRVAAEERESSASPVRGSGGLGQDRQRQRAGAVLLEDRGGHVQARAAAGAGTGPHGQFGDAGAAVLGGLADVTVGHSVTDANVHGRKGRITMKVPSIPLRMRMAVN